MNPALTNIMEATPSKNGAMGFGRNYYGGKIYNPNSKKSLARQYAENIGASDLPIGLQNVINQAYGKQTGAQTALGLIGLPTHIHVNKKKSSSNNDYRYQL